MSCEPALTVNGWTLYAHPLFLQTLEELIAEVDALRQRDPEGYLRKNATKRLAAIRKLVVEKIPTDPTADEYRQGNTLGPAHRHWFRAKFFQQYRLFFRYHAQRGIIVYAWVNDEATKRAYDSPRDAYQVFRGMLAKGRPPSDWEALLTESQIASSRLRQAMPRPPRD